MMYIRMPAKNLLAQDLHLYCTVSAKSAFRRPNKEARYGEEIRWEKKGEKLMPEVVASGNTLEVAVVILLSTEH